jgi:hypothetical protein
VALLDDLDAFYLEHRRCGEMDSTIEGDGVWMTYSRCAAVMVRIDDEERR